MEIDSNIIQNKTNSRTRPLRANGSQREEQRLYFTRFDIPINRVIKYRFERLSDFTVHALNDSCF